MIGKKPYQNVKGTVTDDTIVYKPADWTKNGITGLINALGKETVDELKTVYGSYDGILKAIKDGKWGKSNGEAYDNLTLFNALVSGKLPKSTATRVVSKVQEASGSSRDGYVMLNNHPFHVEPGSFTIKPKLNISQTDMYVDGEDGESYTYMQWLNTTGLVIKLTIYNDVNEDYIGWTGGVALDAETKEDTALYDSTTKVHEVLLWWSKTFTTVAFWTKLDIPNINGKYKITDCEQTVTDHNIVKTELELTAYTQDEMEDTYFKVYDMDSLVESDTSKDTSLATQIKKIPVGLHKECKCTGSTKTTTVTGNYDYLRNMRTATK